MPEKFAFSSGKIRVGAPGATLSDSDNLTAVQNVALSTALAEAMVRAAAHLDNYAIADAQYDATTTMTFDIESISQALIPYICGVDGVTAGGKTTFTGTRTAKPRYVQVEFIGNTSDDKAVRINIPCAKIVAMNPTFDRGAFQKQSYTATSYPNGTGGPYAPFIIEFTN